MATITAAALLLASAAGAVQSDDADDQALVADADYTAGLAALKGGDEIGRAHV